MRALRLLAWESVPQLVEVPVPTPGEGEVLIRVAGNGLCHSDLTMMDMPAEIGEMLGWHLPFTLGHEIAGTVAAIGPCVDDGDDTWTLGDAAVLMSANSCRRCRYCLGGRESLCERGLAGRGYGRDGGLADFVVAPVADLVRWSGPADALADAGTLSDAGATSFHAVSRVLGVLERAVGEGHAPFVVVIGVGGLGAFAVQFLAALTEATIIAIEPNETRRRRALELGAHHALDGVDRATVKAVRSITGSSGAEAVIDLVGDDDTIACGLKVLAKGGAYALVGAEGGTVASPWVSALPHEAEIFTFQGSRPDHVRRVVELAANGAVRVESERFGLDDVAVAYDGLRAGSLTRRAVIVP
ncbi:MAG: alcohol dehydrogenase catalytic domain-containing protein [Actinobacteria bacterium]|nr:alcohol dehydrogenase catalytic domain-containing protein [Actinomycetota bacterium]